MAVWVEGAEAVGGWEGPGADSVDSVSSEANSEAVEKLEVVD